ncbi:MAG TPA: transporter [Chthoniobacter sp.]|jgi:hypothetical protein
MRLIRALCLCSIFGVVWPAQAVPPLVTDDAVSAEYQTFEIFSGFDYERDNHTLGDRAVPYTEFNYGIFPRAEITIAIPYLSLDGHDGFGDVVLGSRYEFVKESEKMPCISMSFEWKLHNGDVARGLGTGKFDYNVMLSTQKTWGWFTAFLETNFDFTGNPQIDGVTERSYNIWFAGFAQQYQVSKTFDFLTEIYCQRGAAPGQPNQIAAGAGFEWEFVHGLALQAEIGKSIRESSRGGPDIRGYVGLHWTFDAPWKKESKDKDK